MRACLFFVLAALAVTASAAPVSAAGRCTPVTIVGSTQATSPAGPFVGTGTAIVGGTVYPSGPIVTSILAPLDPAGNSGVSFTTTSHAITIPGLGTIVTTDAARLVPTNQAGVFRLVTHMVVTDGASGQLHLQGTVNFASFPFTADATARGVLCDVAD